MDFGKLSDIQAVDFALPADHPQTGRVFADNLQMQGRRPLIYVGATGWSNPEWNGAWYPEKTKPADFLHHFSRQFGTIEFNTTHYRIPDAGLIERWYEGAAAGFQFCPKVPQQISHQGRLKAQEATTQFCANIVGLREKLGPIFIQLPEYHGPDQSGLVLDFARKWPRELPLHWEFRHPAWFRGLPQVEDVFGELAELGQGTVVTDVAGRRDVLHMRMTNPVLVLRFVGNGLHPSDFSRTQAWVERMRAWTDAGLYAAYIFIHQPHLPDAPGFCAEWSQALSQVLDTPVTTPKPWTPPISTQQSLF